MQPDGFQLVCGIVCPCLPPYPYLYPYQSLPINRRPRSARASSDAVTTSRTAGEPTSVDATFEMLSVRQRSFLSSWRRCSVLRSPIGSRVDDSPVDVIARRDLS
jgi:hypothetical protein